MLIRQLSGTSPTVLRKFAEKQANFAENSRRSNGERWDDSRTRVGEAGGGTVYQNAKKMQGVVFSAGRTEK